MARFRQRQSGAITAASLLAAIVAVALLAGAAAAQERAHAAPLYEQPVLVIDPGMHTAPINSVGVDAAGRLAVTGSDDKTVRVWQLSDGKLLQTVRMPAGPGNIGKIFAVAMSPEGGLAAASGWTTSPDDAQEGLIYLFEPRTGRMTKSIPGLPNVTDSLAFSPDGRYLAAGLYGGQGLRVFDRDRQWAEAFRDTDYGDEINGVAFAADGRLAAASSDGMIRLYDRGFKPMVPPRKAPGGSDPFGIAFSPDGATLAVGHEDAAAVDLFDGHSLSPLPGPNADGLGNGSLSQVMWSKDGGTLFAGGRYYDGRGRPVLAWANAGRGARRALQTGSHTVGGLAVLPDGGLLVAAMDPLLAVLEADGAPRWARPSPKADFRGQRDVLAVSADGAVVDFGFEGGPSRRCASTCARASSAAIRPPVRRSGPSKPALPSKAGKISFTQPLMASQSRSIHTRHRGAWPSTRTGTASCLEHPGRCAPLTPRVNSCGGGLRQA